MENNKIKIKIFDQIQKNNIRIKPRWYFVIIDKSKKMATGIAIFLAMFSFIMSVYLLKIGSIENSGLRSVIGIIVTIVGLSFSILFYNKIGFNYKKENINKFKQIIVYIGLALSIGMVLLSIFELEILLAL